MNSDNEFVFKIRALQCTSLEFRTGFLAERGFNLKVATICSLPLQQAESGDSCKDQADASISWISVAVQLLILTSMDEVMDLLL